MAAKPVPPVDPKSCKAQHRILTSPNGGHFDVDKKNIVQFNFKNYVTRIDSVGRDLCIDTFIPSFGFIFIVKLQVWASQNANDIFVPIPFTASMQLMKTFMFESHSASPW